MSDTGCDFVDAAHLHPRGTFTLSVRSSEDTFTECCIVLVLERTINVMSPDTLETREKKHGTLFSVFYVSLTACVCPWCPSVAQTHHTLFKSSIQVSAFKRLLRSESLLVKQSCWSLCGCIMRSASLYENRKWHLLTVCPFVTSLAAPSEVFRKRWNKTFLLSCITFPCCLFSAASFIESLRPEIHSTQVSECKCFWLCKLDFIVLWHIHNTIQGRNTVHLHIPSSDWLQNNIVYYS